MSRYESRHGTVFNYNSDFSGNVTVYVPFESNEFKGQVDIDGDDILEFVAYCYIAKQRISKIEEMSHLQLLD